MYLVFKKMLTVCFSYLGSIEHNSTKEIISSYDQLLDCIGDFGWWQFSSVSLLMLPSLAGGIIVLLTNFTAFEPKAFRCALKVREN